MDLVLVLFVIMLCVVKLLGLAVNRRLWCCVC